MFQYASNGITLATILDTRRTIKQGTFPVKVRVTFQRKRLYFVTGKYLTTSEWDKLPETKSKTLLAIRTDIQLSFENIKQHLKNLEESAHFSFERLKHAVKGGGAKTDNTLNALFQQKISVLNDNQQIGSRQYYQDALRHIERFAGQSIPLSDITVDWLKRYEQDSLLRDTGYTTIGMYCRAIRHLLNTAKKNGTIKPVDYPFGTGLYEIPTAKARKLALTLAQIKRIADFDDERETTARYRDLWLFSYLCNGINFADMLRLKYKNIQHDEIVFYRQKTLRTAKEKREISATLTAKMQDIIHRWGNKDIRADNYIFPYLNGGESAEQEKKIIAGVIKYCGKRMKTIAQALGIEQAISTYTARHSYATVLKRSGANIAYISESLGHRDLKTTENYLSSFEKEERAKNAQLLLD